MLLITVQDSSNRLLSSIKYEKGNVVLAFPFLFSLFDIKKTALQIAVRQLLFYWFGLDVEEEVHYVSVLNGVIFAFD